MMSRREYPVSSNVLYYCYDDDQWILEVAYKHRNGNEPVYLYEHVPPKIWYGLQNASSKGKYVWDVIRRPNAYPYTLTNYSPEEIVSERLVPREPKPKTPWWKRFFTR